MCQDSFRNPGAGKPRTCQELLRSFTWSHKGSQCKAMRSTPLIHQMSHATHGLGNVKQSESYTYVWCMFQTFMPVQGEGGAPVSMSDTFSKLIVCLTAAARPSILCFCRGSRCWSGSTQRAAGARGFANQALMTCEAVCSQVPLRCVKTAFVTQGLRNRELVKNFCVPSLGHIREASARPLQGHAVNPTDPPDVSRYSWIG